MLMGRIGTTHSNSAGSVSDRTAAFGAKRTLRAPRGHVDLTRLTHNGPRPDRNPAVHRNLAVSAASPAAATQFGSVPGFSPSAQSQRPAAAGLSRHGSNKATIAAFLVQQARSFEIKEVVKKLNFRWYGRRWKGHHDQRF